ncbi:MAG: nucleotide exchange factor GrpE [Acidimicrobiales bacterium]
MTGSDPGVPVDDDVAPDLLDGDDEAGCAEVGAAAGPDDPLAAVIEQDIAQVAKERDEYLDSLRRLKADFENYRKRIIKQQTEHLERAAEAIVRKLLDVLDTADLAAAHGAGAHDAAGQVAAKLHDVLAKEGLVRVDPAGRLFDPNHHEAVAHEDGDGEPEVIEVMRAGYLWKGRVLRPAMVKVKGR